MKTRAYIKAVNSCQGCPHFCDEAGWCRHPDRGPGYHVVAEWKTIPEDCPLPAWSGAV